MDRRSLDDRPCPLTPLAAAVLHGSCRRPSGCCEIECGDGDGGALPGPRVPAARVRGIDRSPELIHAATARVGLDPEGRVAFKQGGASALPYPDAFFDLVAQVDGRPAVAEIARVLRPGGRLILVASRRREARGGLGGWLLRARLARAPVRGGGGRGAGDGSFSVARLAGAGRRRPANRLRTMDIEGMPLALLVNPSSARRQDAEAAAAGRAAARRAPRRLPGPAHHGPRARRRAGAAGDRSRRAAGGDERRRPGRRGRRRHGRLRAPLGIVPGGRGNDLARVLGIPDEPEAAVAILSRRPHAPDRRRRGQRQALPRHRQRRLRLRGQPHRQRDPPPARQPRLRLRGDPHPGRLEAGPLHDPRRRASGSGFSGYSVAVANSKAYGGGMYVAPDAELDDGEFDIVAIGEVGKLRFLSNLPKVFKGTHVEDDEIRVFRAQHLELSASRPFAVYADGEHLDRPAGLAAGAAAGAERARPPPGRRSPRPQPRRAAAVRGQGRGRAGDRRRQPRQRPRRRHHPARPGAAAAGAGCDRPPRRAASTAAPRSSAPPTARRPRRA